MISLVLRFRDDMEEKLWYWEIYVCYQYTLFTLYRIFWSPVAVICSSIIDAQGNLPIDLSVCLYILFYLPLKIVLFFKGNLSKTVLGQYIGKLSYITLQASFISCSIMCVCSQQNLAEDDKNILEHFMNKDAKPQRKLADMFRDKITEKQTDIQSQVNASSKLPFFFFILAFFHNIWLFFFLFFVLEVHIERKEMNVQWKLLYQVQKITYDWNTYPITLEVVI